MQKLFWRRESVTKDELKYIPFRTPNCIVIAINTVVIKCCNRADRVSATLYEQHI